MAIGIKLRKGWRIKLAAAVLVVGSLLSPTMTNASGARDNDGNSIIWGGCYTHSECIEKINRGDGHHSSSNIKRILYHEGRGITEAGLRSTVSGYVTRDGRVVVNGKTVATGAQSIGRDYMPGSHKSGSVYERPTSVSFKSDSIPAFVNMDGGVFHYAILKPCGNAVRAIAVYKPTPTPTPSPKPGTFACLNLTASQPDKINKPNTFRFTVAPYINGNVKLTGYRFSSSDGWPVTDTSANMPYFDRTVEAGKVVTVHGQVKTTAGITATSEACSATVTVNVSPTPSPSPTPPGQVLGVTLPATGPEAALGGIAGLSAIGVASRYYLRSRKSLLDALRNKK